MPALVSASSPSSTGGPPTERTRFDRLTKRHRECLAGVRRLQGSKEIAESLGIEKSTVDGYLTEAVKLLGARNRRDAALMLEAHERAPAIAEDGSTTSEPSPDKMGGYSVRLGEDPHVPPIAVSPDELVVGQSQSMTQRPSRFSGLRLPYRRKGQADNDLSVGDRLIWIQVIAVGTAVGFGMFATGLQVLAELVESVARHLS